MVTIQKKEIHIMVAAHMVVFNDPRSHSPETADKLVSFVTDRINKTVSQATRKTGPLYPVIDKHQGIFSKDGLAQWPK